MTPDEKVVARGMCKLRGSHEETFTRYMAHQRISTPALICQDCDAGWPSEPWTMYAFDKTRQTYVWPSA